MRLWGVETMKTATNPAATGGSRVSALKTQAKRLRLELRQSGVALTHSQALELLARQHGHRDWNTLHALAARDSQMPPVAVGDRVSGRYLGQAFDGRVLQLATLGAEERFRVTIHFDRPVDVVTFDSFSAWRQRITAVVDRSGRSARKTSNGVPHLVLAM